MFEALQPVVDMFITSWIDIYGMLPFFVGLMFIVAHLNTESKLSFWRMLIYFSVRLGTRADMISSTIVAFSAPWIYNRFISALMIK